MSKVSPATARHYYTHRTEEKAEEYRETHVANQRAARELSAEIDEARTDREGAGGKKTHGNELNNWC